MRARGPPVDGLSGRRPTATQMGSGPTGCGLGAASCSGGRTRPVQVTRSSSRGTHTPGRGDDRVIAQSIEMTSLPRVPAANCSIASPVCSRL
jgi:hypothetical protein